jgi:iron(III) transport system substrate-binding protein
MGAVLAAVALVSAGSAAAVSQSAQATTLTIYSGRDKTFVEPLYQRFTKETGIKLEVRYGSSSSLAAAILEEGSNSPADVFFSQEAGLLGVLTRDARLAVLPDATIERVPARFRAPSKRWIGTSGRARVLAYNTQMLSDAQLPTSVWELTKSAWKGRLGIAPTNASFQAFVAVMRSTSGEDRTRDWLLGLKANNPRFYTGNTQVVQGIARGEVAAGLVNHYYLHNLRVQSPTMPVENHFFPKGDVGSLVNCAGVGILTSSDDKKAAQRFIDFLLSSWAQRFIARGPGGAEYPLIRGITPRPGLPQLGSLGGPPYNLARLGRELPPAVRLLQETGYTS